VARRLRRDAEQGAYVTHDHRGLVLLVESPFGHQRVRCPFLGQPRRGYGVRGVAPVGCSHVLGASGA